MFDPAILIGQLINFALLIWLLRRFLYNPVLNIIEQREKAIQARFDQVEALQAEAREQIAAYSEKQAELEGRRDEYLREARAEADRTRKELLAAAAAESQAARERFAAQLAEEQRALERVIQERLVKEAIGLSERVLRQIAGRSVQDGLIDLFEREFLREQRTRDESPLPLQPPLTVRLSFEPDEAQRERLQAALLAALPAENDAGEFPIDFVYDESLILGIEVEAAGTIVSWSARDYMTSLQEEALRHIHSLIERAKDEALHHA